MARILVCGSRTWTDYEAILEELAFSAEWGDTIMSGVAPGADAMAIQAAKEIGGMKYVEFPADWKKHGRAAGPIRNQQMLDEGKPDMVIAFWDGESRGTLDMIGRAVRAGYEVRIIPEAVRVKNA